MVGWNVGGVVVGTNSSCPNTISPKMITIGALVGTRGGCGEEEEGGGGEICCCSCEGGGGGSSSSSCSILVEVVDIVVDEDVNCVID